MSTWERLAQLPVQIEECVLEGLRQDVSSSFERKSTLIHLRGGGQFELGAGRGHIQYLASLFHPDAPNDVAPSGFNLAQAQPGLPSSPLAPRPAEVGFAWG